MERACRIKEHSNEELNLAMNTPRSPNLRCLFATHGIPKAICLVSALVAWAGNRVLASFGVKRIGENCAAMIVTSRAESSINVPVAPDVGQRGV